MKPGKDFVNVQCLLHCIKNTFRVHLMRPVRTIPAHIIKDERAVVPNRAAPDLYAGSSGSPFRAKPEAAVWR